MLNIYYYVPHTSKTPVNTGVQRVARLLGRHLSQTTNFYMLGDNFKALTDGQVRNMANFNGVQAGKRDPNLTRSQKWLVIPDFCFREPYYEEAFALAKKHKMLTLVIFYDDLHLKTKPEYFKSVIGADVILSISKYSHNRLLYHFNNLGINYQNKTIAPLTLPIEFPNTPRVTTYHLESITPYKVLCVSLFERRKNQTAVVKAVDLLKDKMPIELYLVGGNVCNDEYMTEVQQLIAGKNYIKLNLNVSDEELKKMYLTSHLTVYPSTEEGYGLPIVESIWYNRPCICMNYGVMAETAVAGCAKIDCNNTELLANTISDILLKKEFRDKLLDEIKNLKMKTWAEYAKEIVEVMKRIPHPHKHKPKN